MKIGVFGVGHLGKIHLKCLGSTRWEIAGVYDPDPDACKYANENFNVEIYNSPQELIDVVDAVDIVSTTMSHFDVAKQAITSGRHAFIEKPLADSTEHAAILVKLAQEHKVKIQVGHVERYNPAIQSIIKRGIQPKFIEGHRLTTFNTRGNDVSVIFDLMIHDLDLILSMIDSPVSTVHANGVCVVNDTPDICNARIGFENGAVANLTASRISMKNMRKLRLFQADEYISIDLIKKESQIISLTPADEDTDGLTILSSSGKKLVNIEIPEHKDTNAIVEELRDFYESVENDQPTKVDAQAGYDAMLLAERIDNAINLT